MAKLKISDLMLFYAFGAPHDTVGKSCVNEIIQNTWMFCLIHGDDVANA